jgi:hypothetical protein
MTAVLDILAKTYMRDYASGATEITGVVIDGANANITWVQRDVEIFGVGRRDNVGVLPVPLATLVSQSADVLVSQ